MDEKLRILKMVEDGTITAQEALELMTTLGTEGEAVSDGKAAVPAAKDKYEKKMFRIIVDSVNGDKVNVQFPVGAVKKILKATGKLPIPEKDIQGVNMAELMEAVSECLDEEIEGDFVNVDGADGTKVRIFVGE